MGRPSNKEERREQIARAMVRVMAERGYERASVVEVAEAAELAPGLVHYHYKDKREILLAVVALLGAEGQARLAAAQREGRAKERLTGVIDAYLAAGKSARPDLVRCWAAVIAESVRDEKIAEAYREAIAPQLDLLRKTFAAVAGVRADSKRAKAAAAVLFATVSGLVTLHAAAPEVIPAGTAAETVKRMVSALVEEAT